MFAILEGRSLTDEILSTTLCLVEQTLNARPLTPVSDDPNDLEALTSNHLLLGRSNIAILCLTSAECYTDLRRNLRTAQAYSNMIYDLATLDEITFSSETKAKQME